MLDLLDSVNQQMLPFYPKFIPYNVTMQDLNDLPGAFCTCTRLDIQSIRGCIVFQVVALLGQYSSRLVMATRLEHIPLLGRERFPCGISLRACCS